MKLSRPLILNSLRSQLDAPLRLVIAGLAMLILYTFTSGGISLNGTPLAGTGALLTGGNSLLSAVLWLLGLGLISRDISGGSIQLVLLRPLSRASYVLSKWAALCGIGLALLLFIHLSFLLHQGLSAPDAASLPLVFAAQALQVAAVCAVITLFSTVPINFGELGLLALGALILGMLKGMNYRWNSAALDQALGVAWRILLPSVGDGTTRLLTSLPINAGICVAALAGAMALLQRREFSYAEQAAG